MSRALEYLLRVSDRYRPFGLFPCFFKSTDMRRFMDAEIGVRNLADSFRYNVLPDIVAALGLADGKIGVIAESFEDLPEYERLSMLVSSQARNFPCHTLVASRSSWR